MAQKRRKPQLVVENGEPTAVILDIDEYERMLERLEDADDLAVLQEMRSKPMSFRPLTEFLQENDPRV